MMMVNDDPFLNSKAFVIIFCTLKEMSFLYELDTAGKEAIKQIERVQRLSELR